MRIFGAALIAILAAQMPQAASAQAYQCRIPESVSVPSIQQRGQTRQMRVTGYTAALSWSPEFCKGRETQARHRSQCSGRNGRFGLVMHGMWPEGPSSRGRSNWPQWCPTSRRPSPAETRRNMCMMPSARLIASQWAKHGSCMTQRPETYFKVTRIFWEYYAKPDYDRLSRQDDLTAGDIRRAFADANTGLEPSHVGVKLNSRGWFQELRVCLNQRFRPKPCDPQRFGAQNRTKAKIWRGL
ncbi:ribonuclease T [Sphingomonadaceae bacterium]|nr:ribonuclease T [Sphingomonadaceae bacterium]